MIQHLTSTCGTRRRGFTLIELLVVVSIIALLIAILLPALSAAKASARTVMCASNMKQLGIANHAYIADNRSIFAPFQEAGPAHSSDYWDVTLAPYFDRETDGQNTFTQAGGAAALRCPQDENPFPKLYADVIGGDAHAGTSEGWLTYAMNSGYTEFRGKALYAGVGGNSIDRLNQPSETMHHMDAAYYRNVTDMIFLVRSSYGGERLGAFPQGRSHFESPAPLSGKHKTAHEQIMGDPEQKYRHAGSMNVLYADGHVDKTKDVPGADEDSVFWGRVYTEAD